MPASARSERRNVPRQTASWVTLTLCLAAVGCGAVRDDAAALVARGRYPDALELLLREETRAARYRAGDRARYALYRGLVHHALGDAPSTGYWLSEAKVLFDQDPSCLSRDDAGRLAGAWTSLGGGL